MDVKPLPAHKNRYEKVDVLNLIDPQWLENSQAKKLLKMVRETQGDLQICDTPVTKQSHALLSA